MEHSVSSPEAERAEVANAKAHGEVFPEEIPPPLHAQEERRPAPATNKWLVAVAVIIPTILEVIDGTVVMVALPYIQGSLNASVGGASELTTQAAKKETDDQPRDGFGSITISSVQHRGPHHPQ